MKNIGAFFDIDGTIYRDSLMVEHFKKLIKYEIVDQKAWVAHARDTFLDWDKRNGNYDDYLLEICDLYVKSLLNVDKRCIDFTSDQVIALKAERVYKYTRSKIKWHLENGHKVIFISGSPKFLVEKMAKKYNATDFIGSDYIFEDGKFNGTVIPMWDSKSKNLAIDTFVEKYNIDFPIYGWASLLGVISSLFRHPFQEQCFIRPCYYWLSFSLQPLETTG